jgi:hypothetical protein
MLTLPRRRSMRSFILALGLALASVQVLAYPIPEAVVITGSTTYDTGSSFSQPPNSSHVGSIALTVDGASNATAFADGAATGTNPLADTFAATGDGVSIIGAGSVPGTAEFLAGVDTEITLVNNSPTETYEIALAITFANRADANGVNSYLYSEFTIDQGPSEVFFTDVQSDTVFGDELNGVQQGTFGAPVRDSGMETLVLTLPPGASTVLNGSWTLEGGVFSPGSSAAGDYRGAITIDRVVPLLPDSVLHWKLDEGTGTNTLEEVSGEAAVAAISGTADWVPGIAPDGGNALDFDLDSPPGFLAAGTLTQSGDYVAGSDPDYADLAGEWSMTAWVSIPHPQAYPGTRVIAATTPGPLDSWSFLVRYTGGLGQNLSFAFGGVNRVAADINVPLSTSVFVAILADKTGASFNGNTYRFATWDGTSWHFAEGVGYSNMRLQDIAIGAFPDGDGQFDGTIDDVHIYGQALGQIDIDQLAAADSDGDGIPDFLDNDDDNDGLSDGDEATAGTNSKDPDTDDDGASDLDELLAGTDPLDPDDVFLITDVAVQGKEVVLTWRSVSHHLYSVLMDTDLDGGATTTLETGIPATPPLNVYTALPPVSVDLQYFFLEVRPPSP